MAISTAYPINTDLPFPERGWEANAIKISNDAVMRWGQYDARVFVPVSANIAREAANQANFLFGAKCLNTWNTHVDYDTSGFGGAYRLWPGALADEISHLYALPMDEDAEEIAQPEVDVFIPRVHPRVEWLGFAFRYQMPFGVGVDQGDILISLMPPDASETYDSVLIKGYVPEGIPVVSSTASNYFQTKGAGLGVSWSDTSRHYERNQWTNDNLPDLEYRFIYVSSLARAAGGPYIMRFAPQDAWVRIVSAHVYEIRESRVSGLREVYQRQTVETIV